ncbi:preprotein translocase subunit YajC [Formivibrio citricus]|uniref:Sec translocon accessory complex subunit YajC n=1 Tax=Formivibrio citricus TaxID=83765 RepID=A0A1I4ZSC8_9NEIS|nr:preprotein translocase subunit YajC [Formivibrio citricus]SFN53068.1 preprotein translocase subunit YajC [Formivibrio citricus]
MSGTENIMQFVPLILMLVVFWFLVIRPQQKRAKALQELVASLKKGDEVMMSSGILARVAKVEGDYFVLEIASGVEIVAQRSVVTGKVEDGTLKKVLK